MSKWQVVILGLVPRICFGFKIFGRCLPGVGPRFRADRGQAVDPRDKPEDDGAANRILKRCVGNRLPVPERGHG
jgi:hypothetical protein